MKKPHEFGDELEKLVAIRQSLGVKIFNEKVLALAQDLRSAVNHQANIDRVRAERRTTPRHICESECAEHKYHSWDGEPLKYDGSPFYG